MKDDSPAILVQDGTALADFQLSLWELKDEWDRLAKEQGFVGYEARQTRRAVQHALQSVCTMVQTFPGFDKGNDLGFAFRLLMVAMTDIEAGRPVAWLKPEILSRPSPGLDINGARGRCAALMELAMTQGRTREVAAKFVLRHMPPHLREKLTAAGYHSGATWRTVSKWRENARWSAGSDQKEPSGHTEVRSGYEAMLALAKDRGWQAMTDEQVKSCLRIIDLNFPDT